jgi:hypothetical protein
MIYHAYFHSVLSYGIIVWGNFPHRVDIFRLHKKVITITRGIKSTDSCTDCFEWLKILPLLSINAHG